MAGVERSEPAWTRTGGELRVTPATHNVARRRLPNCRNFPHFALVQVSATVNDAELIQAALAGDTAAFGVLVRTYQDRLFNALVHIVRCPEEAQDVVQDAFVQAYTKLSTFKGSSAFYTWLYRIAFNVSISRRRKRKPAVSLERGKEEQGAEPAADPLPDRLEQNERAAQLHAALEALSEEHRTVLVLREMEDCSYEDIAEMLDLPIGTVRSRLHRARMELRESLKEVMQEP